MTFRTLSKSVAVSFAIAAPLLLLTGGAPLAKKPGTDVDCMVGTAAYPTIQSAVNTATCMTIGVPAGKFRENVTIDRDLEIRGAGPERTTVDATGKDSSVFAITGQRSNQPCAEPEITVTLSGMTITGGTGPGPNSPNPNQRNGGGIEANPGVKLTVENCNVTGNSAYQHAGGINVPNGRLTVVDSVISRNTAYANLPPNFSIGGGGGVRVSGCPAVLIVEHSEINDNVSLRQGGGILITGLVTQAQPSMCVPPFATAVLTDTKIKHNTAADAFGGGGIYYNCADLTVLDSKIEHNYPDDLKAGPNP